MPSVYWIPIGLLALMVLLALNLELSIWLDKRRSRRNQTTDQS